MTTIPGAIPDPDSLREALRSVVDPEAGINIVDLGLVYGLVVGDGRVDVNLTMTSPACPLGDMIVADAEAVLAPLLPTGCELAIALVWDPPWAPAMMSERARRHFAW